MKLKRSLVLIGGFFFLAGFLAAETAALKERFLQRKPVIDQWKAQAKVGEDNVGKLVVRAPLNEKESKTVAAENADRETVYQEIAANLNIPSHEVGKRRAVQIAGLASPGTWLQHADGHWYQKKE
jgi:uncharacterized protein YdbL (DUF1318 family)